MQCIECLQFITSAEHTVTYLSGHAQCRYVAFGSFLSIHCTNLTDPGDVRAPAGGEGDFASIRISQSCLSQRFLYESATGEHIQAKGRYIWLAQRAQGQRAREWMRHAADWCSDGVAMSSLILLFNACANYMPSAVTQWVISLFCYDVITDQHCLDK